MFNKELYNLTLTSDIANDVFPNISGQSFGNDNSFLATLRALVAPHMTSDDTLWLRVRVRNDRDSVLKDYSDEEGVLQLSNGVENNTIFVCGLNGTESSVATSLKYLDSAFLKKFNHFESLDDLRVFSQQQQANIRFYINKEDRSVAIFIANMNLRIWHYVQSLTTRLLPWYFTEKPNDEEKAIALSLTNKTATAYEKLIEQIADKYDFRSKKIKQMLDGFETVAKRHQLSNVESSLSNTEQKINRNVSEYMQLIDTRANLMVQRDGLKYQIDNTNNESEMTDYFICNKHLTPIGVHGSKFEFIVSCYLENFDPEMYSRIAENERSYIYNDYRVSNDAFLPNESRRKLLDAIFSDEPLLKVKMCAYYSIDLNGSVTSSQLYSYPQEFYDRIPNPHLQRHNCLGNHRRNIEECLRNGNTIGAIEQCVASAKSINIGESATFPYFLQTLFASNCKSVIELPDGTSCTPGKALQWLYEQEQSTATEVNE